MMKFKNNNGWVTLTPSDIDAHTIFNSQSNNGMVPPATAPSQMWITDSQGTPAWRSSIMYKHILGSGAYLYRWGNVVQLILYEYKPTSNWNTGSSGRYGTELYIPYGFRPKQPAWGLFPVYGSLNKNHRFEIGGASNNINPTQITFMAGANDQLSTTDNIHISMCWLTEDDFPIIS